MNIELSRGIDDGETSRYWPGLELLYLNVSRDGQDHGHISGWLPSLTARHIRERLLTAADAPVSAEAKS